MNEYFASMADVHRIMGVLDEGTTNTRPPTARRRRSPARSRGLRAWSAAMPPTWTSREWRDVARWFSEQQLRMVHDAAFRVAGKWLPTSAGRRRRNWPLADQAAWPQRMERPISSISPISFPPTMPCAAKRATPRRRSQLLSWRVRENSRELDSKSVDRASETGVDRSGPAFYLPGFVKSLLWTNAIEGRAHASWPTSSEPRRIGPGCAIRRKFFLWNGGHR